MSVQDKPTLKSFFNTGDRPTEGNFVDLIDSLLDQSDGFKNGGSSFGTDAIIGTNDNYPVFVESSNLTVAKFSSVSSAVNYLTVGNSATGSRISISADGADTNIGMSITTKGRVTGTALTITTNTAAGASGSGITFNNALNSVGDATWAFYNQTVPASTSNRVVLRLINPNSINAASCNVYLWFQGTSIANGSEKTAFGIDTLSSGSATRTTMFQINGLSMDLGTSAYKITDTSGVPYGVLIKQGFGPSAGNAVYSTLRLAPTINQTGTSTGSIFGVYLNPTITSLLGCYAGFAHEVASTETVNVMDWGSQGGASRGFTHQMYQDGSGAMAWTIQARTTNSSFVTTYNQILRIGANNLLGVASSFVWGNSSTGLSNTAGNVMNFKLQQGVTVSSGNASFNFLAIQPAINQSGTANGTIRGVYYNPTLTSVLGTHYAWESTSGDMLVGGAGKYLLNDGGTAKVALETTISNRLSIGSGFTNLVLPSTVYLSGSLIAGTSTSALILQTLGGSSVNNGVSVSRTTAITSTSGLVRVLAVSSTFAPESGNAEFNAFLINSTINQTSANGSIALINIHPTTTRVEGNLYGLRSQIADAPTGGGTAWNIYADGTASSYFNHNILIGGIAEASSATNTLHIYSGTAPSGNITDGFTQYSADITAGNAAPHFKTENGDIIKLYKQTALATIDSNSPNSGDGTTDTLISNMRTRINELETTLQNLGLL